METHDTTLSMISKRLMKNISTYQQSYSQYILPKIEIASTNVSKTVMSNQFIK